MAGQSAFKGETVEQEFPLKPMKGTQGEGFFYDATDKNYGRPQGDPSPGEFPVLTHGELGVDRLMLSFTIMSDAKADASVNEALSSIQKVILRPGAPLPSLTRVRGAGLDFSMALDGFTQKMGEVRFKGNYYRIGFYTSGTTNLNLSILVDDLHGMSLADLEKAGIGQSKGPGKILAGAKVHSEFVETPKGFLVSYPAGLEGHLSSGYFQGQWYFETIFQGKWLELHFSKVFKDGEDLRATHAEVMNIVQSIQP